jgi:hypothetical protein
MVEPQGVITCSGILNVKENQKTVNDNGFPPLWHPRSVVQNVLRVNARERLLSQVMPCLTKTQKTKRYPHMECNEKHNHRRLGFGLPEVKRQYVTIVAKCSRYRA